MARERIRTFATGLDEALGGGIPAGSVVLVSGAPGTMKSALCYSVAYHNALKTQLKAAYVTLEQGKDLLYDQMNEMGMKDPKAHENLSVLDMGTIRKNLHFPQSKGSWLDLFKMYAQSLVKSEGTRILILDSLDVLGAIAKFDDPRTDLYHLFEWLRGLGVTSFLIGEAPLDFSPDAQVRDEAYLADGVLQLEFHAASDVYVQRRIRCVKMRSTKHETGYYALVWDDGRFEVTPAVSGTG